MREENLEQSYVCRIDVLSKMRKGRTAFGNLLPSVRPSFAHLSKPAKRDRPPKEHLRANKGLNSLTIVVSFTLAILLYLILGFRPDTHPLIYVTAGLLIAIGSWHIQVFIRSLQLTKQWKRRSRFSESAGALTGSPAAVESVSTAKLLDQVDVLNTASTKGDGEYYEALV